MKKYFSIELLLAFIISLIYLPYLLAVSDLLSNTINIFFIIVLGLIFFTYINFSIILYFKESILERKLLINTIILPIINFLLLFIFPVIDIISIEGNVFAFSLIFVIPIWIIVLIISIKKYEKHLEKIWYLNIIKKFDSSLEYIALKNILKNNGFHLYKEKSILEMKTGKLYTIELKGNDIVFTDKNDVVRKLLIEN